MRQCVTKPSIRSTLKAVFCCVVLCLALSYQAVAQQTRQTDSQIWTETWLLFPRYGSNVNYGYINLTRIGRERGTLVDERNGGFLGYTFDPTFAFTATWVDLDRSPSIGVKEEQQRLLLDGTGRVKQNDWLTYTYRMRFERQYRSSRIDRWELRPRLGIELPNFFKDESWTPFVNFEGFYDDSMSDWYRLRTLVGVNYRWSPQLNMDLYLGNQANRFQGQTDLSIIGFTFRIELPDL